MNIHRVNAVRAPRAALVLIFLIAVATCLSFMAPAQSAPAVDHDRVVSAVPGQTPAVNNGEVDNMAQVGSTMVVGGTFTSVTPVGGSATTKNYVFAFDVSTGKLIPGFSPTVNGVVNEVIPGPIANTVYLGGAFSQVNGVNTSHVVLLSTTTGAVVTVPGNAAFKAAATNGVVNTMVLRGNRLFVGGNFTTAGGVAHNGLASLNANTGSLDSFVSNQVSQRHNDTGSGAQGAVGVRDMDINASGTRLVVIGNFKKVDGLSRDQVALLTLGSTGSTVTADWQTNRYSPYCFNWAFDTYVRGVSFSPDGSYFVVNATGGQNGGTLCDTAARFETNATSLDVQPTWVNYSGGDTLWAVTVTEQAVYVGGHQRWLNNSLASDYAGPGAVPRPGIAALNVNTGMPLKWNPGRNPRGAAVYALYATPTGLWMGSDTEGIGPHFTYKRPRLAFFPLASGAPEASDSTASLPGTAYLGGTPSGSNGNILYRVNTGGGAVGSADNGPDWAADDGSYRNSNGNYAGYPSGATTDASVPSGTPNAIFDSELWSPNDNPALQWAFPAPTGAPLQVRLYFANRCSCTSAQGSRKFDVSIDGNKVLDNFDIVEDAHADQKGTMKSFNITSDGDVNIDFGHRVENPLINGIEIVRTDQAPPAGDTNSLRTSTVSTNNATAASTVADQGIDWTTFRGSFYAGGKVWYGKADGTFDSRTYSNGSFGPEVKIDPYNDPVWAGVDTGSGNTFDGKPVDLYAQMGAVTGMAYSGGKLYYVKSGDSNLYWKWFNADSGSIGADTFTANGGRDWSGTRGMFAAGGKLYFVTKSNGNLNSMALGDNGPNGAATPVDGPLLGGTDWRSRALFLVPGTVAPPNEAPTPKFSADCTDLACHFDASDSTDSDGTITSYSWKFGDNATDSGQIVDHSYGSADNYSVELKVTDNSGNTKTLTKTVSPTAPQPANPITYVGGSTKSSNVKAPTVTIPTSVQANDTVLLSASLSNTTSADPGAGWTVVADKSSSDLRSVVWAHKAAAGDAGKTVTLNLDAIHKSTLVLSAYRGVNTTTPVSSATATTDAGSTTSHSTPTVVVPNGSWVLSMWSEKSSATTKYTVPGSVSLRGEAYSTASGRVSIAVADSNGPKSGSVNGTTATTDGASSRAINWSIVLAPQ